MSIWLLRPIASFFSTGLPYQFAPSNILVRPFLYQLALKYSISYSSLRNVSCVFLQKYNHYTISVTTWQQLD